MRYLIVGDYHAEPSDLADCQALADYVVALASEHQAKVIFTGDQYHTHAIVHVEVQKFWYDFFTLLPHGSISLVGNHDRPGSASSRATAMLAHVHDTHVVDSPWLSEGILFLPYMHDNNDLVAACLKYPEAKTVICHATFDGSKYENGFYAKDGLDLNQIPQESIISGHIHTPQEFGKVWYVGAPRWRTISDAGIDRNLWLIDMNKDGTMHDRINFSTAKVCRQIVQVVDMETSPQDLDGASSNIDLRVDIHGSPAFIEIRTPHWKALGARVRTFKTQEVLAQVSESEGIEEAFRKWVGAFKPRHGTGSDVLKGMLENRVQRGI